MISDDELADIRETVNEALPSTCVRTRYTVAYDVYGSETRGNVSQATYPCRLATPGSRENLDDRDMQVKTFTVVLPHDADVTGDDTLAIDGQSYEVLGPPQRQGWNTHLRVLVQYTTGA